MPQLERQKVQRCSLDPGSCASAKLSEVNTWAKKRFCTDSKISPGALRSLLEATAARALHPSLVRKGQSHPDPLPQLPLPQHTSSSACLWFSHQYPETSSPAVPDGQMASGTTTLPRGSKHRTGLLFSEDQFPNHSQDGGEQPPPWASHVCPGGSPLC